MRTSADKAFLGCESGGSELALEGRAQHRIDFSHRDKLSEVLETGDALVGNAARDNAIIVGKVRHDVERNAVEGHPFGDAHADGGDLVLPENALVRPLDPDADAAIAALAGDVVRSQRLDHPRFEALHQAADITTALRQVQHDIGHALAWAVIGILPAPARVIDGKAV